MMLIVIVFYKFLYCPNISTALMANFMYVVFECGSIKVYVSKNSEFPDYHSVIEI